MKFKLPRATLWSACLLLTACGGGGGGDASTGGGSTPPTPSTPPVVSTGDMFPSALDNRWVIKTDYPQASTYLRRISSATTADGAELITINNDGGANPSVAETYKKTADALWSINEKSTDALSRAMGNYQMLRLPLKTGDTFNAINRTGVASTVDFDLDGKPDTIDAKIDVTVEAKETLPTPFGNVEAWRVKTYGTMKVYLTGNGKSLPMNISMLDWYSPGIGMVKRRSEVLVEGAKPVILNEEVDAYKTSLSTSSSTPPKVVKAWTESIWSTYLFITFDRQVIVDEACSYKTPVKYSSPGTTGTFPSFPTSYRTPGSSGLLDTIAVSFGTRYPAHFSLEIPPCISDLIGNKIKSETVEFTAGNSKAPLLLKSNFSENNAVVSTPFNIELIFDKPIDKEKSELHLTLVSSKTYGTSEEIAKGTIDGAMVSFTLTNPVIYDAIYWAQFKGTLTSTSGETEKYDFSINSKSIARPFNKTTKKQGYGISVDIDGDGLIDNIYMWDGVTYVEIMSRDRNYQPAKPIQINLPDFKSSDYDQVLGAFDFNGDGRLDLITRRYTFLNEDNGYTPIQHSDSIVNFWSSNLRFLADYDGDQIPDLIEFRPTSRASYGSFAIHKGKKNSKEVFSANHKVLTFFSSSSTDEAKFSTFNIQVRDMNGDGIADFYADQKLYLSTPTGSYRYFEEFIPVGFNDFDGDGKDELVVLPTQAIYGGDADYYYIKLNPDGSWSTPAKITNKCSYKYWNWFVRGDFNKDGATDIAFDCSTDAPLIGIRDAIQANLYKFRGDILPDFRNDASCLVIDVDNDGYPDFSCAGNVYWNDFKLPEYQSVGKQSINTYTTNRNHSVNSPFSFIRKAVETVVKPSSMK